jgi:hypothetical protein
MDGYGRDTIPLRCTQHQHTSSAHCVSGLRRRNGRSYVLSSVQPKVPFRIGDPGSGAVDGPHCQKRPPEPGI